MSCLRDRHTSKATPQPSRSSSSSLAGARHPFHDFQRPHLSLQTRGAVPCLQAFAQAPSFLGGCLYSTAACLPVFFFLLFYYIFFANSKSHFKCNIVTSAPGNPSPILLIWFLCALSELRLGHHSSRMLLQSPVGPVQHKGSSRSTALAVS